MEELGLLRAIINLPENLIDVDQKGEVFVAIFKYPQIEVELEKFADAASQVKLANLIKDVIKRCKNNFCRAY